MKRVRIKKAYAGPRGTFGAGTVIQMSDDEAASWIGARMGEEVGTEKRPASKKETATEKSAEKREKAIEG